MPPRLIIHAPNIHTGGGKSLLDAILASLPRDRGSLLVADERLAMSGEPSRDLRVERVPATLRGRIGAERWLVKHAAAEDVVLAFGNLPPLFRLRGRVVVFLQNRYLVDEIDLGGFPFAVRMRLRLERYWFASRIARADEVVVQTPSMKNLLLSRLGDDHKISVFPFIGDAGRQAERTKGEIATDSRSYDFVYVASGEPHKNHHRLVEAWCLLAEQGQYPSLLLTLDKSKFSALCDWIEEKTARFGLKIDNTNMPGNRQPVGFYTQAGALIYPSLLESFGLPLVEAQALGLPVLASELDYVRDVLDPDQSFDPGSSISIARAVQRHLGLDVARPEIRDAAGFVEYLCGRNSTQASGGVENN